MACIQVREDLLLQCDESGLTPLVWAAKQGQLAAAELFLSYGGRLGNNANTRDLLTSTDDLGATPFHHAARSSTAAVRARLEHAPRARASARVHPLTCVRSRASAHVHRVRGARGAWRRSSTRCSC